MPPEAAKPATATAEAGRPTGERKRKMLLHTLIYVGAGGVLGFAYHKLVGCSTGACPITANPYISTLYGAFIGLIAGGGLGR
jgi:hypothetical protein